MPGEIVDFCYEQLACPGAACHILPKHLCTAFNVLRPHTATTTHNLRTSINPAPGVLRIGRWQDDALLQRGRES